MAKKKASPKSQSDAKFKADYKKARKSLKKLELQIRSLKNDLLCLAHDPHTGDPHMCKTGDPHGTHIGVTGDPHGTHMGMTGGPHGGKTGKPIKKKKQK